jgi:hypothetical protein
METMARKQPRPRRSFTREFKAEVVALVRQPFQYTISERASPSNTTLAPYSQDELRDEARRIVGLDLPGLGITSVGPTRDCSGLRVTVEVGSDLARVSRQIESRMRLEFGVEPPATALKAVGHHRRATAAPQTRAKPGVEAPASRGYSLLLARGQPRRKSERSRQWTRAEFSKWHFTSTPRGVRTAPVRAHPRCDSDLSLRPLHSAIVHLGKVRDAAVCALQSVLVARLCASRSYVSTSSNSST